MHLICREQFFSIMKRSIIYSVVAATQIPEEYLTQMSTKSLLNTILNNPLMSDYLFFDNPIDGIIVFSTSFNGTKELLKRDDAKDCLLEKLCLEEPEIAEAGFVELFTGAYVDSLGISKEIDLPKFIAAVTYQLLWTGVEHIASASF